MEKLILFGAGSAGRYALKHLRSKGIEPLCFADTNRAKIAECIDNLMVSPPMMAQDEWPDATWVATAISRPAATEIRAQLKAMGVKTKPLWECLPVCHGAMPERAYMELQRLAEGKESWNVLTDQRSFRADKEHDYDQQDAPSDCKDIYFPNFIQHRDDEHFVDCGAADGDTIRSFRAHWEKWKATTAIEPDQKNFERLAGLMPEFKRPWGQGTDLFHCGVSDFNNDSVLFAATGDYSAHIDSNPPQGKADRVSIKKLDDMRYLWPPTYIKMDIEGSELEALWGARRTLKEHSPVLAICAYHTSDHLWQIPLLIHAIQPDYQLFLRRYAEGAFELVWYAVPPERVK